MIFALEKFFGIGYKFFMIKTFILLAALTAIFLVIGYSMAGMAGLGIAFVVAMGMNFVSYWKSDKIVLKMYKAQPLPHELKWIERATQEMTRNAGMPMPKMYVMENEQPNAFATGRNPENAAVAVTTGLVANLDANEVLGVVAHELAHIKNRDTLTMTVTATVAGAIGMLANFGRFIPSRGGRAGGGIAALAAMIIAPMAAGVVQMAISRTREYGADAGGAEIMGDAKPLASALAKIANIAPVKINEIAERNPSSGQMFIYNPLKFNGMKNLFSTHPPAEERIKRLLEMQVSGKVQPYKIAEEITDYRDIWK